MATGSRNNKSQQIVSRVPLELISELEKVKEEGESTAGFVVASIKGEIKRRQRKQSRQDKQPETE
ncbi:YlcI/YnfO family protein [Dickeya dadantii]|uniref:YlcI/YnfO family protein n=1 Tax=Dickeya dadantii TaxID=204038 RepID=UPI0035A84D56